MKSNLYIQMLLEYVIMSGKAFKPRCVLFVNNETPFDCDEPGKVFLHVAQLEFVCAKEE